MPDKDPLTGLPDAGERDIRPVVTRPSGGLSGFAIVIGAIVLGLVLFGILEGRRQSSAAPAVQLPPRDTTLAAPAPLYLPPVEPAPAPMTPYVPPPMQMAMPVSPPPRVLSPTATAPSTAYSAPPPAQPVQPAPAPRTSGGTALVSDTSQPSVANGEGATTANGNEPLSAPTSFNRASAGVMANRATTVTQGTLIPAVLETAFDSTRPGFARALVQRDIRGFDGTRVLIPRGSRLIGEYGADTAQGQSRAMIAWSRLIRPDGVTIAIGSPAADTVGRGGVRAAVNNHFFQRFAGAILQSTLNIGVNLASRSTNAPVVVALPGSVQSTGLIATPTNIRPTLRVAQGTGIGVFVARDLDFTDAESHR